ncbi:MAG: Spy/CpxP family protein refolding chaperone [Pyrinomonadaceae bacterium]
MKLVIPTLVALLAAGATSAVVAHSEGSGAAHQHHWKKHAAEQWAKLKADLNLNPAQDFAWQQIAEKRAALHQERRADRVALKETMKQELAKSEPDFARIVRQRQQVQEQSLKSRSELDDMQIKLYESFNTEQKAVMRDAMKARLQRMEQWREKAHG